MADLCRSPRGNSAFQNPLDRRPAGADFLSRKQLDELLPQPAVAGIVLEALLPALAHVEGGNRDGQRQQAHVEVARELAADAVRHDGHQVGGGDDARQHQEVLQAQRDAGFQAAGEQGLLDDAVAPAAGRDDGMGGGGELARRDALADRRMILAHQADVAVVEQALDEESGAEFGQVADRQVDFAATQGLGRGAGGHRQGVQADAGGAAVQARQQARQEVGLAEVGEIDGEAALRGGRVEAAVGAERGADAGQALAQRSGQFHRIGRRHHGVALAHEEPVAGGLAQSGQRVADRRLRQAQVLRGPADRALGQHRLEHR